jgi:hypothetical protein
MAVRFRRELAGGGYGFVFVSSDWQDGSKRNKVRKEAERMFGKD